MLLHDLVETSVTVGATPARLGKVDALAAALRRLSADEVEAGVAYLSGELRQRQIGVGWAALSALPAPAAEPSLTIAELDEALGRIGALAGPGSQSARRAALAALFVRATEPEQRFLRALLSGELRQGALAGVMVDAVAKASGTPVRDVRRALMLRGDLKAVAAVALSEGAAGLAGIGLVVGRPVHPMLAKPAADVAEALERMHPAAVEFKLDGVRVQVHRSDGDVAVFSRTLDDVTARVPEVVEAALALPARTAVLDGEAIALRPDGRPHPFQVTSGRLATAGPSASEVPLTALFFDVLHAEGEDVLDLPGAERFARLAELVPEAGRVPRSVAEDAPAAAAVLGEALARGHEGVVIKSLEAPYEAGRRGTSWLKVKPVHTLDLVVLAAEWGHGRRRGRLSNLHLGARAPDRDGFVMLGKTFKGLTDEMLAWQTERLLELATDRSGHVVRVRPELVVEVAFDGIQTSPRYPGGVALRFARVLRHRPDKRAEDADTLDAVLATARE